LEPREDTDEPFDGTPTWRVVRTLRDGTSITIRGIMPEDREELRRAFRETSAQTRYLRFLSVIGDLTETMLDYLTRVDQEDHVALVATVTSPDLKSERGIGVARVVRLEQESDVGEAAITVTDDMQKRGVGSALALEIERAARVRGIRHIRADVLEGNAVMRSILENAGARRVDSGDSAGTLSYDIAIEPTTLTSRLEDVLRSVARTVRVRKT
jgi:GNAT superfamily N-acetyltransferase